MPQEVTEQLTLEAASTDDAGALLVEFITPGWGSSGYYSREVVEAAAPLFAVGTHMYLDHPTAAEETDRPVRSVKDLAAVITEAGVYKDGGIRGKVKPFGPYRDLLLDEDFATNIGLSIRASASDIVVGEAEGRRGPIIEGLVDLKSVDFVTRAGRGGRVLQVLESASHVAEARNIGQWVESRIHRDFTVLADDMAGEGRLTRDERIGLSSAIGDALAAFVANLEANQAQLYTRDIWADPLDTVAEALARISLVEATADERRQQLSDVVRTTYAGERRYAWVRDFDDTTVWFESSAENERSKTWAQAYTPAADDMSIVLDGERTEVRPVTKYVPVTRPGSTTETEESEEDTMPQIQIEEAEHARLVETAGRVNALEERATTAEARADAAEAREATANRNTRALAIVGESDTEFDDLQTAGLVASLPLTEAGELDEVAFTTRVTEAATKVQERLAGASGRVTGFGGSTISGGTSVSESDIDNAVAGTFGRSVKEA